MPALVLLALLFLDGAAPPTLDYQFFKERVQPIFLQKRPGHARCIACHDHGSPPLEPLARGASTWTEEQSRKNFAVWKQFVHPGDPLKSKMLLHPLLESAGGDRFHAGGKHWASQDDPEWQTLAAWVRGEKAEAPAATAGHSAEVVRVLQSNSAGDNIHVIDPATNRVVGTIEDIQVPHGVAIAPGGARIYVSDEALKTLDVVDAKTLKVTNRAPLSGRPNNLAVGADGKVVYVGIRQEPGAVDVVDTASLTRVKTIRVKGPIHNVYVTPDGKWAVAGSIEGSAFSVIDTSSNELAWSMPMSAGVRPMAFTTNADGSTKEIIVQLSEFHGFAVVDFATHKEVRRVTLPDPAGAEKELEGIQGSPSHGLAITPDGKLLWAASKWYGYVAAYSLPDFKLLKAVPVGSHPEWLTIPPDGRTVYVALAGQDAVAAVDIKTVRLVKTIPVGAVPKRNASGVLRGD
jgi:YVTN family beta-propeller protein